MNFKERIVLKLDEMKRYVAELEAVLPESEHTYRNNLTIRRACEKTIELAIECVIDVLALLVSSLKLGAPKNEDDIIVLLEKSRALSPAMAAKIRGMKGFRNILVHRYGEIDDGRAYSSFQGELKDFSLFEKEINAFLKNK